MKALKIFLKKRNSLKMRSLKPLSLKFMLEKEISFLHRFRLTLLEQLLSLYNIRRKGRKFEYYFEELKDKAALNMCVIFFFKIIQNFIKLSRQKIDSRRKIFFLHLEGGTKV